jgi:hypothetical protein
MISGTVFDRQGNPIDIARIELLATQAAEPLASVESHKDGEWSLFFEKIPSNTLILSIHRPHFQLVEIQIDENLVARLRETGILQMGEIQLERRITAAFWAATLIFVLVLILIAFEKLHSTTAALAGLSAIFLVSFVGGIFSPDLFIFDFDHAIDFINWNVIFLVMAMMIIIAIIERTGIFQWMAFQAYRLSRGHSWLLVLILMLITAFASALLDNFTTMLLMTPISLQIGLALGINPLALIIPEVLASNVGGITTLIGTPTNILIGAYAGIGFSGFLENQTVGVLFALLGLASFVLIFYRNEWGKQSGRKCTYRRSNLFMESRYGFRPCPDWIHSGRKISHQCCSHSHCRCNRPFDMVKSRYPCHDYCSRLDHIGLFHGPFHRSRCCSRGRSFIHDRFRYGQNYW